MPLEDLTNVLRDSSRPVFLFGSTPPKEGTSEEKAREACAKFAARSSVLATDGFIVYDIQEEKGRTVMERPFPFRKTLDSAWYASLFKPVSGKECVVYKSVVEESIDSFDTWLQRANETLGHQTFTFVGAPSSKSEYKGPTLIEAMNHTRNKYSVAFGCVCIPERHTSKGNENLNMIRKVDSGAEWFITQGIYSAGPIVKLLNDYGDACKSRRIVPKKIVLTFAPCGRPKTMTFIKWLGMDVPAEAESRIFQSSDPVQESTSLLCEVLTTVLAQTGGSGVPIGINVESLSIFKEEIDAAHDLFQRLQAILLNSRGSPWSVRWFCVRHAMSYQASQMSEESLKLLERKMIANEIVKEAVSSIKSELEKAKSTADQNLSFALSLGAAVVLGVFLGRYSRSH